jgi:hypothetical protein
MAEVLHLEESAGVRAGDPRGTATPGAGRGERFELSVNSLESVLGEASKAVVKYSLHVRNLAYALRVWLEP